MSSVDMTPVYDTRKLGHPAWEEMKEAYRYRHLIRHIIRRDVLSRYKRSFLGITWTMLNPLGTMLVMVIVFSALFGREASYPVYVLSGLLAWNFFSETTVLTMHNLVWGSSLLSRIYIPRTVFAIASIGTGLVNLGLAIIPLMIVMLFTGVPIKTTILFLPIPALLLATFSLGVGLLLSITAIYFPDVAEMYQVFLRAWMYLTPIIYPEAILGENLHWVKLFNPLYHLITLFRVSAYEGRIPGSELLPALLVSLVAVVIGWFIFTQKSDEFAYRV